MKRKIVKKTKDRILMIQKLLQTRIQILAKRGDNIEEDYQVVELSQSLYQLKERLRSLAITTTEG